MHRHPCTHALMHLCTCQQEASHEELQSDGVPEDLADLRDYNVMMLDYDESDFSADKFQRGFSSVRQVIGCLLMYYDFSIAMHVLCMMLLP